MGMIQLPKRFTPDFSNLRVKPKGNIKLSSSSLLDQDNTFFTLFQKLRGLPRAVGGRFPFTMIGTVSPAADLQGTYRQFSDNNWFEYGTLTDTVLRPTTAFTVFAKVRRTGTLVDFNGILTGPMRSNGKSWLLLGNVSNGVTFGIEDTGPFNLIASNSALTLDKWSLIVGTWDGTNMSIYVDGVKQTATTTSGAPDYGSSTQIPTVGTYPEGHASNEQWQGDISFAGITHKSWTEGQVRSFSNNPYQLLKLLVPPVYFPVAALVSGRIMGSIAGQGGLAGKGGIAGPGGGLVG